MPSRNIIKYDIEQTFYHVYSRGINKQVIFNEEQDYTFFIGLIKRYLGPEVAKDTKGLPYPNFGNKIELLSYCLMPNHIHLLVYQLEAGSMQQLMRSLMTSYSIFFNRKYGRRGPLFESRYKASNIDEEAYLEHISRYIHLNPKNWRSYKYSSLKYFTGKASASWLKTERILTIFNSVTEYEDFLNDYEGQKAILDDLKHQLADN